jgi:uncharacterized coiled-coil protein SlyX
MTLTETITTDAPVAAAPKKKIPGWGKIAIGVIAGMVFGSAIASTSEPEPVAAPPAAIVEPVEAPAPEPVVVDGAERIAELEEELATANRTITDCRTHVRITEDAVNIFIGAFERQTKATYKASIEGATPALAAEQEAIISEINMATAVIMGAPGC